MPLWAAGDNDFDLAELVLHLTGQAVLLSEPVYERSKANALYMPG